MPEKGTFESVTYEHFYSVFTLHFAFYFNFSEIIFQSLVNHLSMRIIYSVYHLKSHNTFIICYPAFSISCFRIVFRKVVWSVHTLESHPYVRVRYELVANVNVNQTDVKKKYLT